MIVFVSTLEHAYTVGNFLRHHSGPLKRGIIQLAYPEFLGWRRLPAGTYIFSDLDRLPSDTSQAVSRRWQSLVEAAPGTVCLNHPDRFQDRWQLLAILEREGINPFKARRLDRDLGDLRYPVFLRHDSGHVGPLTDPLADEAALRQAADGLLRKRGFGPAQLWAVEYLDFKNDLGHFEKFSAIRVGDQLFAHDLTMSQGWVCKDEGDLISEAEALRRDREFRKLNPHADRLRPIFDLAGIDYGRIDYALRGGELVVFEINPNPYIIGSHLTEAAWQDSDDHIRGEYTRAMTLLGIEPEPGYWVDLQRSTDERVCAPNRWRRGLRWLLKRCAQLHREAQVIGLRERFRELSGGSRS